MIIPYQTRARTPYDPQYVDLEFSFLGETHLVPHLRPLIGSSGTYFQTPLVHQRVLLHGLLKDVLCVCNRNPHDKVNGGNDIRGHYLMDYFWRLNWDGLICMEDIHDDATYDPKLNVEVNLHKSFWVYQNPNLGPNLSVCDISVRLPRNFLVREIRFPDSRSNRPDIRIPEELALEWVDADGKWIDSSSEYLAREWITRNEPK